MRSPVSYPSVLKVGQVLSSSIDSVINVMKVDAAMMLGLNEGGRDSPWLRSEGYHQDFSRV